MRRTGYSVFGTIGGGLIGLVIAIAFADRDARRVVLFVAVSAGAVAGSVIGAAAEVGEAIDRHGRRVADAIDRHRARSALARREEEPKPRADAAAPTPPAPPDNRIRPG